MLDNAFRLHDVNVRYGETPGDAILVLGDFSALANTNNVIRTDFAPGTRCLVVPFSTATVDADGNVTMNLNPTQTNGQPGGFMLIASGHATQGGIPRG